MAAYGATVSLMHILDLLKNHPSPPISLQKHQVASLTQVVTFLQDFLEGYVSPFSYSDEADPLEMRIADAVYAAEDVIESYIVDTIHLAAAATSPGDDYDVMESDCIQLVAAAAHDEDEQIRYINFHEDLQKVIEAMDLIKKEAMGVVGEKGRVETQLPRNVSIDAASKSSSSGSTKSEMVGFEDELLQLKERLVRGESKRQIIPIVGMGGIGKTTLARNVFTDQLIIEHFDICLWATISQDYNIEQTLREVLSQGVGNSGEDLHKYLFGRRYLVVLDDMWSIEVWDKMRFFFPDCDKGSRVIVTTRMSDLATHLSNSRNSLCLSFLNEVDSWTLFTKTVVGDGENFLDLQLQLREIGKEIVEKCKGLPLSITVIGGLLARSEHTQGYWEYIEKNLNSKVNLENEEYCLRVLKLSYNHLPAYLKPCFLYMGMFDEDSQIKVSRIINLWVSEGFLKPKTGKKNLKMIAREYFKELVDRNLILVVDELRSLFSWSVSNHELGSFENDIKVCKMHDLVRDLSLREAQKQGFYYVYNKHNHLNSHRHCHRRIVIPDQDGGTQVSQITLESSSNARSYVSHDDCAKLFPDFRLLRTLHTDNGNYFSKQVFSHEEVFGLVNARLLSYYTVYEWQNNMLCSSISWLWSLHTLLLRGVDDFQGPIEFWNMHQLKHVEFITSCLQLSPPPPLINDSNIIILENLHTLIGMKNFHLNEDVVRRIPNLTIFDVCYDEEMNTEMHSLSYLQCLSKLESFRCFIEEESGENMESICFPQSLKEILLIDERYGSPQIEMEDVLQKIGWLPFLEELTINCGLFKSSEWETIEGQFPRLKTLKLISCRDLIKWTVSEGSPFPLLQELLLDMMDELEEIPLEIGEIAMLKSIVVISCSDSIMLSAKRIVEEQEDLHGEEELSFRVLVKTDDEALKSLASRNFQVEIY